MSEKQLRIERIMAGKRLTEEDHAYWRRQTPNARMRALQLMRRAKYGPAADGPMEKFLTVVRLRGRKKVEEDPKTVQRKPRKKP